MYVLPPFAQDPQFPIQGEPIDVPHTVDPESASFRLSTFYTVAIAKDGRLLDIKNEPPTVYADEDLLSLAQDIIAQDDRAGSKQDLDFYKADKGDFFLVAFMDNTVANDISLTLLRYTLFFGSIALVVFFFVAVYLAGKIVKPLERNYQKQKQFVSDAGHELKTPISVVSTNAELLSRGIGENQWLQNIQYENHRMGMLVGQLLDLARTENISEPTELIDLSRLVAGEALPFESVAFEQGLTLNTSIAEEISLQGNSHQLRQLTSILLDNAIRHSTIPGNIYLTLGKEHNQIKLTVTNSGEAIPQQQQEHIFERFYRIDSVRNSQDNHYGLGLAIAKGIVSAHRGAYRSILS
jgi:signal transduction histidine kinase